MPARKWARRQKLMMDAIIPDLKAMKENAVSVVHNPLDAAAEKLLVPAFFEGSALEEGVS